MICTDCKYCIQIEYGYTNWTVEGTEDDCLLGLNPKFPVDNFYDKEPSLKFADDCSSFIKGNGVYVDCDIEDGNIWNYSDDPEIIALLKKKYSDQ